MRLIDADVLKKIFDADEEGKKISYNIFVVNDKIDSVPTIEERKTGRWIVITKMDERTLYECSVCGKRVIFDDLMDLPSYCDHCGAKMEGTGE